MQMVRLVLKKKGQSRNHESSVIKVAKEVKQPRGVNPCPPLSTWVCVLSSTPALKDDKVLPQRAAGRMEMEMKSLRAESCKDT